jgi:hypothetical protein
MDAAQLREHVEQNLLHLALNGFTKQTARQFEEFLRANWAAVEMRVNDQNRQLDAGN